MSILKKQANQYVELIKDTGRYSAYLASEDSVKNSPEISKILDTLRTDLENKELWLKLSIAYQKLNPNQQNYKNERFATYAAYIAYTLSKTKTDQALALLVYGNILSPTNTYATPNYMDVFKEVNTLVDIRQLREAYPQFNTFMAFTYQGASVKDENNAPTACFVFSHPLNSKIRYEDFVTISPKVDGILKAYDTELCLSPVKYGETYEIALKPGLKDRFGDKIVNSPPFALKIKDRAPRLSFGANAYVLKKSKEALVPLTAVNVDTVELQLFHISLRNLQAALVEFNLFLRNLHSYDFYDIENKWGELLWQGEMDFKSKRNLTISEQIPVLNMVKKLEPGIYIIHAKEKSTFTNNKPADATQWFIVSDIGLTTFMSGKVGLNVQARSLKSAEPMKNITVELLACNNTILGKTKTNHDGMALFESHLLQGKGGNRPRVVMVYGAENDFSFLDLDQAAFDLSDRGVAGRSISGSLDAYLFTEQGVYRPGDTVHVNTLLRDAKLNAQPNFPLTFKVKRSDGVTVIQQTVTGNKLGFYELDVPLPSTARTSGWEASVYLDPKKAPIGQTEFSVADFVPSRISLTLTTDKERLNKGETLAVNVSARYLFGADAAGLNGKASFTVEHLQDPYKEFVSYSFGLIDDPYLPTSTEIDVPTLNKEGKTTFSIPLEQAPETSLPLQVVVKTILLDEGGRLEHGSLTLPLITKPFMIGIKPEFSNNTVGEDINEVFFNVITVAPNQKLISSSELEYELFEEEYNYNWYQPNERSPWTYKSVVESKFLGRGTLATTSEKPSSLAIQVTNSGSYRLEIRDPVTLAATSVRFQKGWYHTDNAQESPDVLLVKTKAQKYRIGDTAEFHIETPFDGEALVVLANEEIIETRNIKIHSKNARVKFPVTDKWRTGVYCLVSAVRPLPENNNLEVNPTKNKPLLPTRTIGVVWAPIDMEDRLLKVDFSIPKEVLPHQKIDIPIAVKTLDNKPFTEKVAVVLMAVDEGILQLTNFKTPNPPDYFFEQRSLGFDLRDLYGKLIAPLPGAIGALRSGGGDSEASLRNMQALNKKSFKVVSLYKGLVNLDHLGKAVVPLELPDFNGQLHIMAVAFSEKNMGNGDAMLLVRDPVVVEGVLPRFLAPKDESFFSVSVHNVAGRDGEYTFTFKTENGLAIKGKNVFKMDLKQNSVGNISLPIQAISLGDSKILLNVQGPNVNMQKTYEMSVRAPSPFITVQNSSLLKPQQKYTFNKDLLGSFIDGTQQINISWTQGAPWNVALLIKELKDYPYGCVKQQVSKAFGALYEFTPNDKLKLDQIIARLTETQNVAGAFPLWPELNSQINPWVTIYTTDFLGIALEKDSSIPRLTYERALTWISDYLLNISESQTDEQLMNVAYGLYVLAKANRIEAGPIRYFYDTYFEAIADPLSRAFIAGALAIKGELERADQAFQLLYKNPSSAKSYSFFGSELRNQAAILTVAQTALLKAPALKVGNLIEKLKMFLTETLKNKTYLSTQELAWVLQASQTFEYDKNKAPIQLNLNGEKLTKDGLSFSTNVLAEKLQTEWEVENIGQQNVWQHVVVSGLPKEVGRAQSHNIELNAKYYTLSGIPITQDKIKQGDVIIQVIGGKKLTTSPNQLLLVDLLPAGLELESRVLLDATSSPELQAVLKDLTELDHFELRDDRFLAVFNATEESDFKLAYRVRAVTPGHYVKPGAYIEDMYSPSDFAETASGVIDIVKE